MRFHEWFWWKRPLSFPPKLEQRWGPIFLRIFSDLPGIRFDLFPFSIYVFGRRCTAVGPQRLFKCQKSLHFGKR